MKDDNCLGIERDENKYEDRIRKLQILYNKIEFNCVPLKFNNQVYDETISQKKLKFAYLIDNGIISKLLMNN